MVVEYLYIRAFGARELEIAKDLRFQALLKELCPKIVEGIENKRLRDEFVAKAEAMAPVSFVP